MKSKPVLALASVADDLRAAITHYASWRSDAENHVLTKYLEVSCIAWNPDLFPKMMGPIQRAILKQSYYIVYYIQERGRIIVLAVLDGRRSVLDIRDVVQKRRKIPL